GVLAVAFSPDGDVLAATAADGTVRLWDVKTWKALASRGRHDAPAWALAFSPDGKLLASGSNDKTAKVWDVFGMQKLGAASGSVPSWIGAVAVLDTAEVRPTALAYAPDCKAVVVGTGNGAVQLRDAKTGEVLFALSGHEKPVTCVAFAPD